MEMSRQGGERMTLIKTMQAVQITGPRSIRYAELDVPAYKPDEVLVKVHCLGVCATDLEIYQGTMVYFQTRKASYPVIPGHEWSGQIVAVGSGVRGFSVGDRVVGETTISCGHCAYCQKGRYNLCPERLENGVLGKDGAAAEYMVYPAHALHRFDDSLTYEEACLIEPAAVAFRCIHKMSINPQDTVAVIGAGPIGLLAVQMAKACGSKKVVLFDIRDHRLQMGLAVGADEIVNLSLGHNANLFSAVIEATGNCSVVESLLDYVVPGARIGLLGLCGGKRAAFDLDKFVTYDLEMHGSLGSPGVWDTVVELLQSRKVDTGSLISHRFELHQLEKAFELMDNQDPSILKIVLNVAR
jgi:L-iditol 2-dehydrogenase